MKAGGYSPQAPPDPLVLFKLPNLHSPGANVWAFQKAFGSNANKDNGKWGFDVYFESLDGTDESQKQTCETFS